MKALIVYAHPNPQSFNHAILGVVQEELAKKGAEIKIRDLYAMKWDPVLSASDFESLLAGKTPPDISSEQSNVSWADLIVFIYPIWWFEQPAILKGWIDRVLAVGFAYKPADKGIEGLLGPRKAVVITTSGADEASAKHGGMIDAINTVMINGTLSQCGFQNVQYKNLFAVPTVSDEERKNMLQQVRELVQSF